MAIQVNSLYKMPDSKQDYNQYLDIGLLELS